MHVQNKEIEQKIEHETNINNKLVAESEDLDSEIYEIERQISMVQNQLQKNTKDHDMKLKKKENLKSIIGEKEQVIKSHNSALNNAQRQEFANDFVQNNFIEGTIDPKDLENWKKRDSSESETSQEEDGDVMAS